MKLSAEEMLSKYSNRSSHPIEVRRIAMMIFDEANDKIKEMPPIFRKYLEAAALLHDVGYYVDSKNHNKHSQKMVMDEGLQDFSEQDLEIIGCICRYHRGKLPDKAKHEIYKNLEKKDRKAVKLLGGILRVSDGFDRAHMNLIRKIKLNFDEATRIAEFMVTPNTPEFQPDLSSAIRKRDLFEIGFKCQSVIKFSHV